MKTFRDFIGELVVVRDVTGYCCEGVLEGEEGGMLPEVFVTGCRQIGEQDARVTPMTCQWWDVGDQVFLKHHIVGIHKTNLAPRPKR
jgi:hypothetical protein